MPYLIDGHNLIPKLGLSLEDPDDEMELIRLLQDFARIRRQPVEVYFDGAPAGQAGERKFGAVKAHFVRRGRTADSAIRLRLEALAGSAKNWAVVSSDHEVQNAARVNRSRVTASEEFVKLLRETLTGSTPAADEKKLSAGEVEEWLDIFNGRK
ncbi:MAG: NYN domain-containing protein [Anaerolineales bacterium]|jgi:predicted RNA-binding protein with PIN domain|nr:NYN domain-containing protein [Chloroflexota bacterium]MBK6645011.1 NYN domain-containing protein [Anaerolineales bacterium]MCC6985521.1 NYN domain-containing protein [Anaerolineales bacterium]